jgi:IS30 family transposase
VADKFAERKALRQRFRAALKNPLIFVYVREKLRLGWSPEIISGRMEKDHPGQSINPETIYKYIYSRKTRREKLFKYLELGRKKRRTKTGRKVQRVSRIKGATSIDLRPKSVDKRKISGHWETDNMEGTKTDKQVLSATIERVTRVTLLTKLKDRKSITKSKAVIKRVDEFPNKVKLSLTADNGSENTRHKMITNKLGIPVYFCHAYHSWEKVVENRIKKIRRILPKGESLDNISDEEIKQIEHWLNNTPMKVLDYMTPYEKMQEVLIKLNSNNNLVSGALQERM